MREDKLMAENIVGIILYYIEEKHCLTHDRQFKNIYVYQNLCSKTRDMGIFIPHILLPFQNMSTLPIMQHSHRHLERFGCLISVTASVVLSHLPQV